MDGRITVGQHIPEVVDVVIEVPRGSLLKRRSDGSVAYVSPLPSPWNYGSVPDLPGADGEPVDAVVLGARLRRGQTVRVPVQGVVRFVDAGLTDDKLVCGRHPVHPARMVRLLAFFHLYARVKRTWHLATGRGGETRCLGWEARGGE